MFTKKIYEEYFRLYNFAPILADAILADGETLATGAVTVIKKQTDSDESGSMVSDVSVYDDTKVKYKIKAGEVGKTYIIEIKCVTTNGQKFEDWLEMRVV